MPIPNVTQNDFIERLVSMLPKGWFSNDAVTEGGGTHAVLSAIAGGDHHVYAQLLKVQAQLSILTAEGDQLDAVVYDYFGDTLPRYTGESDAAYRSRAISQLLLPVGTRPGMESAIERATGRKPRIVENKDSRSSGGLASAGWDKVYGPLAWNLGGMWYSEASHLGAYQARMEVYQPEPTAETFMTYSQLMRLIATVKPSGSRIWVRVVGPPSTGGVPIASLDSEGTPILWTPPD